MFIIDHAEKKPQGIHLWYKGVPFPRRVIYDKNWQNNHFLRALNALGTVKKYLYALTYLKSVLIPRTLNIKKYEPFLKHLYSQINWQLEEFNIKDDEYSEPVWEIGKFVRIFLETLGLSKQLSKDYAKVVMMILEFDCAYRYRVQDIFGAISLGWFLYNPRKWIKQGLEIYLERETVNKEDINFGARQKILKLKIISKLLWIPRIKRAWQKAAQGINYNKVLFDENDRFHLSFWQGYNFEGKTLEERFKPWEEVYKTIPFIKRDEGSINSFLTE